MYVGKKSYLYCVCICEVCGYMCVCEDENIFMGRGRELGEII